MGAEIMSRSLLGYGSTGGYWGTLPNRTQHRRRFLKSHSAEVPLEVAAAEVQGFEANADHYFELCPRAGLVRGKVDLW